MTPDRRAYLAWAIVCVVWGTTYLAIRVAIDTIPPLLMTSSRWLVAGGILLGVLKLLGQPLPSRAAWPSLAVLGVLFVGIGNGAVVLAEQVVPSGLAAVLVAITPFWMIGIERFAGAAPPVGPRHVLGLLLGFAGVLVLVWPALERGSGRAFLEGVAATQCACVAWAAGSNYARARARRGSSLGESAAQMVFGGLLLLAGALVRGETLQGPVSTASWMAVVYLVFVGSIVAFSAYAYALERLPLAFVSLYAYINPIIAVLLGSTMLGEPLTPRLILASVLVLAGVAVVRR